MSDPMSTLAHAVKFSIEINQLRQELEDIPAHVREVESNLKRVEVEFNDRNQEKLNLETRKNGLEQAHRAEKENLATKEARLNSIKTEKEYRAVSTEITTAKTALKEQEKQIEEINTQISTLEEELKPLEEKRAELQKSLGEEKNKISGSLSEREDKINSLNTQLKEQLLALPDDIREKYHRIERQKQPPAALVVGGTCQACFMSLPPQLAIEVQKGHQVHTCPTCHRLLFLEE